ncbi:MAG: M24 family metallopeptidase [Chloroflexi bacterium]|nr:M24 family metallopeptidase [Chloroflexota bacterium]
MRRETMAATLEPVRDPVYTTWELPTFSMEERERRWGRVRDLMRRDGIDCIVGLNSTGTHNRNQADVRYLTQIGNNCEEVAVCFPIDGKVTAITNRGGYWPSGDWIGETMRSGRAWSASLVQCLKEAGMDRATVGVCGLTHSLYCCVRQPDGYAGYTAVTRMKDALPNARFVSASDLMGETRFVKSPEEIEFLRRGTQIAERACHAMLQTARVGVFEPLIMANMYQAEIAAGGSMPVMFGWVSGPLGRAYHRIEQPTHRLVESGDYLTVEIEGRWGGYTAQIDQSVTIGEVPSWAPEAHKAAAQCFWDIVGTLRPGATSGELQQAARRVNVNGKAEGFLTLHGRGLGDDGPLITNQSQPEIANLPLQEGNVFIVKPSVRYNGMSEVGHVGDSVAVTATGVQRLGTRPIDQYWHVD